MSSACKVRRGKSEVLVGGCRSKPARAGLGAGTLLAWARHSGGSACPRALCTAPGTQDHRHGQTHPSCTVHREAPKAGGATSGTWWASLTLSARPQQGPQSSLAWGCPCPSRNTSATPSALTQQCGRSLGWWDPAPSPHLHPLTRPESHLQSLGSSCGACRQQTVGAEQSKVRGCP